MIAYKLCRQLKNGDITSLFIDKKKRMVFNKWMQSESHPTKNFKLRPFWHCTENPIAPHLSKRDRVWIKIEIEDFTEYLRPESQGGKWFLANRIKLLEIIKTPEEYV